jgi:ferritin-like metal-binding protein YciE
MLPPSQDAGASISRSLKQGEQENRMAVQNPKELFVMLLSNVRHREERSTEILKHIGEAAKDPDIKEAVESHVFLKSQMIEALDRCFKLIGEKPQPQPAGDKLHDMLLEDFRKEVAEIHSPAAKHLFVLAKIKHVIHARIAEYVALTAMADLSGHYGVGVLLETCLAEKLAFVERAQRLMRRIVAHELGERLAA